jgi:hypothetical protein
MSRLRAEAIFTFDAPSIEAGGRRLRELQEAARQVGFELRRAEVQPDDPEDRDDDGWTPYAPT